MFIFARCLRSTAAVTPVKYGRDIIQVTSILFLKKGENNDGTGEIVIEPPTPELYDGVW